MQYLLPTIVLLAMLGGAIGIIAAPKAWQRATCLIAFGIIATLILWPASYIYQRATRTFYCATMLSPTPELWKITADNLANHRIAQAQNDIAYILEKWPSCGETNYTIEVLVREIKERQSGEQGVPDYRRQSAPQPEP